jgi:protein-S-isoprenylcysteine O-methyltransferase Ste14
LPCDRAPPAVWRSALQWRKSQPGEREDRADRWVIIAFAVIGLLSAYLPAYTTGRSSGRSRRIPRWLRMQFGGEYDAYRSRTSRLLAGLY